MSVLIAPHSQTAFSSSNPPNICTHPPCLHEKSVYIILLILEEDMADEKPLGQADVFAPAAQFVLDSPAAPIVDVEANNVEIPVKQPVAPPQAFSWL